MLLQLCVQYTLQAVVILKDHDGRLPRRIGVRPPVTTLGFYGRDLFVVLVDQGRCSVCERLVFRKGDARDGGKGPIPGCWPITS